MQSDRLDRPFNALPEELATPKTERKCNQDDAFYWVEQNLKYGCSGGAAVGAAASLSFFGYKYCVAAGGQLPTNPIDPCDGKVALLCVVALMVPGALAGALAGGSLGTLFGFASAPIVGYYGVPKICDNRQINANEHEPEPGVDGPGPRTQRMS